jgi:4-aminobutyrate aminotransferase-like enzyme
VRGKGLFYGVEIVRDRATKEPGVEQAARIREYLRENGILLSVTGPLNNVMKIRPPMVLSKENADRVLEGFEQSVVVG